uniref:hypothetical protein n=1 Tax=Halomonas sp. TaxID=1486246 RepID=UPI00261D1FC9|nr:hypothetical protein [Halomonas sp.]
MKQRIELTLERIDAVAREMAEQDEIDRAHSFATVKVLLDWLREVNREYNHDNDNSYASEKLLMIEWSTASIAGLDHGNGHEDSLHLSWLDGEASSAGSENAKMGSSFRLIPFSQFCGGGGGIRNHL